MTIDIPEAFRAATIEREGQAGEAWLGGLPQQIEELADRWDLIFDGPSMHGYLALVVPVVRDSAKRVLKVSWIDRYTEHEAMALEAWHGDGAVQIFMSDESKGAMLLERLDSDTNLESLKPDKAIKIAGELLRRLAVSAPIWARNLSVEIDILSQELPSDWKQAGKPFPLSVLEKTLSLLSELRPQSASLLVNHDLHYGNVLAGDREPWLAIDPKVFAGDPEYAVAQLLWQDFAAIHSKPDLERRLDILVESAELDGPRARKWAYVRAASNWLWGLNVGLTHDPVRCRKLVEWL